MSALITADILTPGALEADAGTAKLVEGPRGPAGAVYTPSVTGGLLSWTNDGGLENPAPADIRGPKGDKGDPGEAGPPGADGADGAPGTGLAVLGQYDSAEALAAAVTDPALGDNYYVGESAPFDIYTWTKVGGAPQWVNGGALQGAPGGYYLPAVDAEGNLSWTASESGMDPAPGANIRGLGLFANMRPAYLYKELAGACPLKPEIIGDGFDMVIMRELTGGLYFGDRYTREVDGVMTAVDTLTYNEKEIRRIAVRAFDIAMKRRKKVTSVDKANVLDSSRLWRKVVEEVAKDYPEVELSHMLVDNCAMQLVMNPGQFDVILTENMFGDILSDEASMITGSIGMLSSASLNESKFGLYEPSHGSAPDIAGKDIANPIATILSAAMLLRYSLDMDKEAAAVEAAVQSVLTEGWRTADIMAPGCRKAGTAQMGSLIADII